jgi:mono/diheme cytochrome c family protein
MMLKANKLAARAQVRLWAQNAQQDPKCTRVTSNNGRLPAKTGLRMRLGPSPQPPTHQHTHPSGCDCPHPSPPQAPRARAVAVRASSKDAPSMATRVLGAAAATVVAASTIFAGAASAADLALGQNVFDGNCGACGLGRSQLRRRASAFGSLRQTRRAGGRPDQRQGRGCACLASALHECGARYRMRSPPPPSRCTLPPTPLLSPPQLLATPAARTM